MEDTEENAVKSKGQTERWTDCKFLGLQDCYTWSCDHVIKGGAVEKWVEKKDIFRI